jgi:hypothetical protein
VEPPFVSATYHLKISYFPAKQGLRLFFLAISTSLAQHFVVGKLWGRVLKEKYA